MVEDDCFNLAIAELTDKFRIIPRSDNPEKWVEIEKYERPATFGVVEDIELKWKDTGGGKK